MEELQNKKVVELKELARTHIGRGFSNLRRKQELVEALRNIPEVMEEMRNLQRQRQRQIQRFNEEPPPGPRKKYYKKETSTNFYKTTKTIKQNF